MPNDFAVTGISTPSAAPVDSTNETNRTDPVVSAAGTAVAQDVRDAAAPAATQGQADGIRDAIGSGLRQAALDRTDVADLVSRFSTEAARHPSDLAEEIQDTTSKAGRDMADVNRALRAMTEPPARTAGAAEPQTPAEKLRSGLAGLVSAADGKGTGAQSAAAMYAAAAIQCSAEHFSTREAQTFVANTLFADALVFFAASNEADARAAAAKLEGDLSHLESLLGDPPSADETEILSVIRDTLSGLTEAKLQSAALLENARPTADGGYSVREGDFGYHEAGEARLVQTDAKEKLVRFGGVMTPKRDAVVDALQKVDQGIAATRAALEADDMSGACSALSDLRTENAQAHGLMKAQVQAAGLRHAAGAVESLFTGAEPAAAPGTPQDAPRTAKDAADQLLAHVDWSDFDLDHFDNFMRLSDGVSALQNEIRTPAGDIDESAGARLRPSVSPREEILAHMLLKAPWTTRETADLAGAALAEAAVTKDEAEAAQKIDQALTLLRADLGTQAARFAEIDGMAERELSKFAVDQQHPLGGMRGGLAGLAADCRFERFSPHTTADGMRIPGDLPKTVFARMTETIASGLEASNPSAAALTRKLTADFMNPALSEAEQKAAFDGITSLLTAVGLSGSNFAAEAARFVPAPSAEGLAAAGGDLARAQADAFAAMLADPTGTAFADAAQACLRANPGDREAHGSVNAFANALLARAPSASAAPRLNALALATENLGALALNDFFTGLLGVDPAPAGETHLRLSDLQTGGALDPLLSAGRAYAASPDSQKMLELIGALTQTDGDAVRTTLAAERERLLAASGKTGDELKKLADALAAEESLILSQFDVLKDNIPTLFYGAHSLYALESGLADPYAVDAARSENAAFVTAMKSTLPEGVLKRCTALMRPGLRGEGRILATGAALASLKATAAHLGRTELVKAFGAETDVNIMRALRYYASTTHPGAPYDTSSSLSKLTGQFLADTKSVAAFGVLGRALNAETQAAQSFQRAALAARMNALGVTDQSIAHIQKGFNVSTTKVTQAAASGMQGQTAGMALMAFNYATLNRTADFDSETLSRLVGHYVDAGPQGQPLTNEDLQSGALRAASLPMYERECAVILNELMRREAAAGRPADIESILARMAPETPRPEVLMTLTPEERDLRLHDFETQEVRFAQLADRLRGAYRHNAASAHPHGPSLACVSHQDAAALVEKCTNELCSETLMQGIDGAAVTTARTALGKYQEALQTGNPDAVSRARRNVCAALTPAHFDRGRYVLMTKVHSIKQPAADDEAKTAWEKLDDAAFRGLISHFKIEGLAERVATGITPAVGELTRTALSAQGTMAKEAATNYLHDLGDPKTGDPKSALALKTAVHCAAELTAEALGTTVEKMFFDDPKWKKSFAVADIRVRDDQPALAELLRGKAPSEKVPFADIMAANMTPFMGADAAKAYTAALTADKRQLAAAASAGQLLRNQVLRKSKYFAGLAADIRTAQQQSVSFAHLRDSRAQLFHERQRGLYAACLESMPAGSSVAIDKHGNFEVLGASLKVSSESKGAGDAASGTMEATLEAGISVDLSDGIVFTKNADGTVSVAVSKAVEAGAHAGASAKAGVSAEVETGSGKLSGGIEVGASVSAGVSASYTLTVEQTLCTADCADFMDRLVSGNIHAEQLNRAVVAHSVGVSGEIETEVSAGAALGFAFSSPEPETTVTVTTDAQGNTVETAVAEDDGNTIETVTVTEASGRKESHERVTDESGSLASESHTVTEADGSSRTVKKEQGTVTPFSEGLRDPSELLEASASVSVGAQGGASASRTVRETPSQTETEYHYTGQLTLRASASVSHEGVETAADLAGAQLDLSVSESATFGIDNTYTRVDSGTADKTLFATKRTACTFPEGGTPQGNAAQLRRLCAAQQLPAGTADQLVALALTSDLPTAGVSFESAFQNQALLDAGPLTHRALCDARNYVPQTVTLSFAEETDTTGVMTRIINHAGKALNGAFEFRSTAARGQEITIDLEALSRVTPDALQAALDPRRIGSLTPGVVSP